MPRTARILLPHTPHHVIQRGHNRASVFAHDSDYRFYLDTLIEWKEKLAVKLYAFCLMTNHVHLIVEPADDTATVGKLMRRLAGRQTRRVNSLENRTGTLWSGRYRASAIQTDQYLLACCRYVELNPVRARIESDPAAYSWSSCIYKVKKPWPQWLDEDICYRALGNCAAARQERYRRFIGSASNTEQQALIRDALNRNQLTGNRRFIDEVEARIGRRVELRGRGRPPKAGK